MHLLLHISFTIIKIIHSYKSVNIPDFKNTYSIFIFLNTFRNIYVHWIINTFYNLPLFDHMMARYSSIYGPYNLFYLNKCVIYCVFVQIFK